jgi:predicted dehydrogenase
MTRLRVLRSPSLTRLAAIVLVCSVWPVSAQSSQVAAPPDRASPDRPLRLAIAGLVHGHVHGFMKAVAQRSSVELVGVFEPDAGLRDQFRVRHALEPTRMFASLDAMLATARPDAIAAFTNTFDHLAVVEAAAARSVHVMVEKPLAVSMAHAQAIERAAGRGGIHVIVNYETTWYPSHQTIWQTLHERRLGGPIRKIVAMDGHPGPKEIGVQPEFLDWLRDPVRNGAGALFDFGCYGANLMTWLMDNERPLAVTAMTQRFKPAIYPKVDDEASILIEYPSAQGIVQASWNWPFNRKDLEVYAERAYAIASGPNVVHVRLAGEEETTPATEPLPPHERDAVSYLAAIVRGERVPSGLSSLTNNLIVMEILEAARESARTGRTVRLSR